MIFSENTLTHLDRMFETKMSPCPQVCSLVSSQTLDTQYGRCRQFNGHSYMSRHQTGQSKHQTGQSKRRPGKSGLTILAKIPQDDYIVGDKAALRASVSRLCCCCCYCCPCSTTTSGSTSASKLTQSRGDHGIDSH